MNRSAMKLSSFILAALMTVSPVPVFAEETGESSSAAQPEVSAVSDVSWCGNIPGVGTYPQRALSSIAIAYPEEVETDGISRDSFTVTDKEDGRGNMNVDNVTVEGNTVTLNVSTLSNAGILTSKDGNFRRKQYSFDITENNDVYSTDGTKLSDAGDVLTLNQDQVKNTASDEFRDLTLKSSTSDNEIYIKYYVPENASGRKLPMVIHSTGGSQQYNLNTQFDKAVYGDDNFGVELDIDLTPKTFSVNAPEDTIMVSVQGLAMPMTKPEGYDAGADINQTVQYFIDNFNVDADRVYAIGNSAGGINMSQAVYEKPELYAAYFPCNSSLGEPYFSTEAEPDVNAPDTSSETYKAIQTYAQSVANAETPVYFHIGRNDHAVNRRCWNLASDEIAVNVLKDDYRKQGYTEDQINNLVNIRIYEDSEFNAVGSKYYHGATGLMCLNKDAVSWLYAQKRNASQSLEQVQNEYAAVYRYDARNKMTEYNENFYTVPTYLVYSDHAVNGEGAYKLVKNTGLMANADQEAAQVFVVNPIGDDYGTADDDAYLNILDKVIGPNVNQKVIGIGNGATFVNKYVSQKDWMLAGVMTWGGEAGDTPKYDVPAYVSGAHAAEAVKPYRTAASKSDDDRGYLNVVQGAEDEGLADAFANAWDRVFSRNGRIGNIGGTFYDPKLAPSKERPYEYYGYLNSARLGLTRNVVNDVDLDGDGTPNLWYEYLPKGTDQAEEKSMPVVVMLHGNNNDPRTQATTSGWPAVAAKENVILVEAEHQGSTIAGKKFDSMSDDDSMTPENGIVSMVQYLEKKYPQIDPERIYVEGLSKGSVNSLVLGIVHSDVFAAVGGHSAGFFPQYAEQLKPMVEKQALTVDTPAFIIGGTADNFPPGKRGKDDSTLSSIQLYEEINDLPVTAYEDLDLKNYKDVGIKEEDFGDRKCKGNTTVYGGNIYKDGRPVLSVNAIENWGHWNYEPAAQMMWDFFSQHTLHEENQKKVIDGADQTWTKNTDKGPAFTTNAKGKLLSLIMGDVKLDAENYAVNKDGAVTLDPQYLSQLKAGTYTLKLEYEDGTAETTLKIIDSAKQEAKKETSGKSSAPKTSDSFHAGLFASLLVGASALAAGAWFALKKNR